MEENRVNVEELKQAMAKDFERLAQAVAAAMNAAKDGSIIADTEELVRDANAAFRERTYAKAIRLLQNKQEAFSPSAQRTQEQGPTTDDASDGERASLCAQDNLLVDAERDVRSNRSVAGPDGVSVQSGGSGDGLS
jgi:hypothetical protein